MSRLIVCSFLALVCIVLIHKIKAQAQQCQMIPPQLIGQCSMRRGSIVRTSPPGAPIVLLCCTRQAVGPSPVPPGQPGGSISSPMAPMFQQRPQFSSFLPSQFPYSQLGLVPARYPSEESSFSPLMFGPEYYSPAFGLLSAQGIPRFTPQRPSMRFQPAGASSVRASGSQPASPPIAEPPVERSLDPPQSGRSIAEALPDPRTTRGPSSTSASTSMAPSPPRRPMSNLAMVEPSLGRRPMSHHGGSEPGEDPPEL